MPEEFSVQVDGREYTTLQQYCEDNVLTEAQGSKLRRMCNNGEVDGAIKQFGQWFLPEAFDPELVDVDARPRVEHSGPRYIAYLSEGEAQTLRDMGIELVDPRERRRARLEEEESEAGQAEEDATDTE